MTVGSPQQSTKGFVSPVGVPIKKTPPIADIIEDQIKKEPEVKPIIPIDSKEVIEPIAPLEPETFKAEEEEESVAVSTEDFPSHWATLFDTIFSHTPTIYYPLKGYVPKLKGNVIHIDLKNEIQKEHFDPKIREVLSYLRTHFNEAIEDILVNVDESIVTKKIIYDTVDKMQNLNEQNANFEEFSSILDLKVKE